MAQRGGSQPDPTVRSRVMAAVIEEIVAQPLSDVSMDQIAARADVSKATIYKRWDSKRELLLDVFADRRQGPLELDDFDTFDEHLDRMLARVAESAANRRLMRALIELVSLGSVDEDFQSITESVDADWRRYLVAVIELGQREGRVDPAADPAFLAEVMSSTATMRGLQFRPFDEPFLRHLRALLTGNWS